MEVAVEVVEVQREPERARGRCHDSTKLRSSCSSARCSPRGSQSGSTGVPSHGRTMRIDRLLGLVVPRTRTPPRRGAAGRPRVGVIWTKGIGSGSGVPGSTSPDVTAAVAGRVHDQRNWSSTIRMKRTGPSRSRLTRAPHSYVIGPVGIAAARRRGLVDVRADLARVLARRDPRARRTTAGRWGCRARRRRARPGDRGRCCRSRRGASPGSGCRDRGRARERRGRACGPRLGARAGRHGDLEHDSRLRVPDDDLAVVLRVLASRSMASSSRGPRAAQGHRNLHHAEWAGCRPASSPSSSRSESLRLARDDVEHDARARLVAVVVPRRPGASRSRRTGRP